MLEFLIPILLAIVFLFVIWRVWKYFTMNKGGMNNDHKSCGHNHGDNMMPMRNVGQNGTFEDAPDSNQIEDYATVSFQPSPAAFPSQECKMNHDHKMDKMDEMDANNGKMGMVMMNDPDGSIQMPAGDYKIPMKDELADSYPEVMLSGKVGTFSPTYACDRFICDGCSSCAPLPAGQGCKAMTDDMGRNYIATIDKIRQTTNSQFPQYNLS